MTMMNPKETTPQRTTSNVTVPGGRITVKVLEFLFQPLLKAQWQAGYEIGYAEAKKAQFEAWKARQRAAGVKFVDDDELPDHTPQEHAPTLHR